MDDLISRQAAIDAIISFFKLTDYNESAYAVRTVLGDLPSVQSEIIRCKDCKFSRMTNDGKYCKYCEHFHIDYEPYKYIGAFTEPGRASCSKHDLVTDFFTKKKFETLSCVEEGSKE